MRHRSRSFDATGFWMGLLHALLMMLVVLAPLPLGANREWAWTLCALWAACLGVLTAITILWRPRSFQAAWVAWAVVLFAAVCAWAWIQGSALTPPAWHHPAWELAAQALGEPLSGRVSLSPDDGAVALMRLVSYALVFALAFALSREPVMARRGLQWLSLAGMVYSVYGLWVYASGSGTVLWLQSPGWTRDVRGTFINHNSFATWAGLCLLCSLAVFYPSATLRRNPAYRMPVDPGARFEAFMLRCWRPLAAILVTSAALILSHSRGGFISAGAGVLALLLCIHLRQPIRAGASRLALVIVSISVGLVFWLSSEVLVQRLDRLTADYQSRMDAYELTLEGIADNPVLGFGYGTFDESMRLYRDDRLEGYFDKAHNTFLETTLELGWPAALGLGACLVLLVAVCVGGLLRLRQGWIYPATGLAATLLVGVHSMVDFSLQIPAVAITYAAIMGIACAQSGTESSPASQVVYTPAQSTDATGRHA